MKTFFVALALVIGPSVVASAADTFKVEYVSGKEGFSDKIKGQLVVSEQSLTLMDGKKVVFTIPMTAVTKASDEVQNNSGGYGRKLMFGGFSNRSEGFLYVTTETESAAEAITFKVDQNEHAAITAKIQFAAKKAKSSPPAPTAPERQ
jgi:hypothetical protein